MKIVDLGTVDYQSAWNAMRDFTNTRQENTEDELWIVQHECVFTEGISAKPEHILFAPDATKMHVIRTDRGGQVTYHAPGQLIIYCLIDLKRLGIGVKKMVSIIEDSIMDMLRLYQIKPHLKPGAPGVYVGGDKIAALGLKVKNGKTYHGLSVNVDMDLSPFKEINPCGDKNLQVVQMRDLTDDTLSFSTLAKQLTQQITNYVTSH